MKKLLISACILVLACTTVMAKPSGLAGALAGAAGLTGAQKDVSVTKAIPEGKKLAGAVCAFVSDTSKDEKVIDYKVELKKVDLFNDTYSFNTKVFYKFGIGVQCQEADVKVNASEGNFVVTVSRMVSYGVNNKGEQQTDSTNNSAKSMNTLAEQYASEILNKFNLPEEEFNTYCEKMYGNINFYIDAANQAGNKIKQKKFYNNNNLENKNVTASFLVVKIDESKVAGYDYAVTGMISGKTIFENVMITFNTNNDKYVDLKAGDGATVTGKLTEIKFTDSEVDSEYRVHSVVICE